MTIPTRHQPPTLDMPAAIMAAAGRRLDGRWDDPAAWHTVCEEATAAWCRWPDAAWAVLVPVAGASGGRAVAWIDGSDGPAWVDAIAGPALARLASGAAEGVGASCGRGIPPGLGITDVSFPVTGHWTAAPVPDTGASGLVLVVGLAPAASANAADQLALAAATVAGWLAPLHGQRRANNDLAAAAESLRADCETLSRLSDLRTRLAAVTAHELKTPLTSITAYSEVLAARLGRPGFDQADEFLGVIRTEADRLLRLVDRMLDFSRRGRLPALTETGPVAAGPLIGEVVRMLAPQAEARRLRLTGGAPTTLPCMDGDADLLRQVLVNLVGNALKFTPAGGSVTVGAGEDASTVRLSVTDTGPGIAPDELRTIFQAFYRARGSATAEGVGLGLSIVREIVNLHGGHLDVASTTGEGTTFSVLLPKQQYMADRPSAMVDAGVDPALQRRLGGLTLRLVAELMSARGAALLLPEAGGDGLFVAGVMGLPAALCDRPAAMAADGDLTPDLAAALGGAANTRVMTLDVAPGGVRGAVAVARHLGDRPFDAGHDDIMAVLADLVGAAWRAALTAKGDPRRRDAVIEALAVLAGLRRSGVPTADPEAVRVLAQLGRRLGLAEPDIHRLRTAGVLHDAGMAMLDPDVVLKPADLDEDEREHVGRHLERGVEMLTALSDDPELVDMVRLHHERVDGRGHPEGRQGDDIPLGARIIAVVDAWYAMIRPRPWRAGMPAAAAMAEISRHAGTQFDADVVDALGEIITTDSPAAEPVTAGPADPERR